LHLKNDGKPNVFLINQNIFDMSIILFLVYFASRATPVVMREAEKNNRMRWAAPCATVRLFGR